MNKENISKQLNRVKFDLPFFLLNITVLFIVNRYYSESMFIGTIVFKALGANAGFLHGHITRKLAFPSVNWKDDKQMLLKILIIVIYASMIFAWSRGG